MARIVIDPVSRVGGQLRVEAEAGSGKVSSALVSATMYRGMEAVLRGRDPRDAWLLAQRICGTCTGVHAQASVRAVEAALGMEIPLNASLIRNLLAGVLLVRDHVMTLYQRALPEWVDISSALTADPATAAEVAGRMGPWARNGAGAFSVVRDKLQAAYKSGQPGFLGSAWSGHPAYALSPEQSLVFAAHAIDALEWQRDFMRIHTLLSGKEAHPQTFLVGGMAVAPPWGGPNVSRARQHPQVPDRNAPLALSAEGLDLMRKLVGEARTFVEQVAIPDTLALAAAYPEWISLGTGPGGYLCNGEFPDATGRGSLFPNGRLVGGNLEASQPAEATMVSETIRAAWYTSSLSTDEPRPPMELGTEPAFSATVPLKTLDERGRYTWVKAPRMDGVQTEAGPLARILVGAANGRTEIVDAFGRILTATGLGPDEIGGALGRSLARAVELDVVSTALSTWLDALDDNLATGDVSIANVELWDPTTWPDELEGASLGEGPRGAVNHWVRIRGGVIDAYQVVDGSTWNASPRDSLGRPGPLEAALVGVPVADPARPVELLRVIHSFAPCAACAAHVLEAPRPMGPGASAPEATR